MPMHIDIPQSRCRFAIAQGDITPPTDIYHRMWGAAKHDRATGIHQPLRATVTALAPAEGDERQVIIALDHCVMGRQEMDHLLADVSAGTGISRTDLIVVFSHTHAAGLMGLERGDLPGGNLIAPYLDDLAVRVVELAREARDHLQIATLVYGTGRCNLAAHRDFWDEENELWACGYNPGTPADDTVLVGRAHAEDGTLLATIVNYACHPTTLAWGNTLISPDYPGAMRDTIEAATGAPCLFLQGASGELGPVEGFVSDPEVAERNGRQLAYAALSALEALPAAGTRFAQRSANGNTRIFPPPTPRPTPNGNCTARLLNSPSAPARQPRSKSPPSSPNGKPKTRPRPARWSSVSAACSIV